MIFNTILSLMLLAAPVQIDAFKREKATLQQGVDTAVTPVVARVMQQAKATYLEGFGIVVTLEVTLATPPNPFGNPVTPAQLQASVAQRRNDLRQKMSAFVTEKVSTLQSVGATESLAVVVHILNTTPADVPNLPTQMVFTVKKASPSQVVPREI